MDREEKRREKRKRNEIGKKRREERSENMQEGKETRMEVVARLGRFKKTLFWKNLAPHV